jgi:hypothetical protein
MASLTFFLGSLVPTFVVSRLFLLLLRKWRGGYLSVAIANALSVLICAGVNPHYIFGEGIVAYLPVQAVWVLVDAIIEVRRSAKMERAEREWNEKVDSEQLRCVVCRKRPPFKDCETFGMTGMCGDCAEIQTKQGIGARK